MENNGTCKGEKDVVNMFYCLTGETFVTLILKPIWRVFLSQFSGNCSNMPKVSPVKILKEEVVERQSQPVMMGETQSDHDTDSEVDIN